MVARIFALLPKIAPAIVKIGKIVFGKKLINSLIDRLVERWIRFKKL